MLGTGTLPLHAADRAAPARILCFGDSITEGSALPKDEKPFVWPKLVTEQSEGRLTTINEGKGGRPTASVEEFITALDKHQAEAGGVDVVLIALGTNDSRDVTEACVPKAVANVTKMVEHSRKRLGARCKVLLVGPPNIRLDALGASKPIGPQRDQKLKDLGVAFQKLAKQADCEYVTLYGVVPPESLTRDGVHPDKAGNQAIAKVLVQALLQAAAH